MRAMRCASPVHTAEFSKRGSAIEPLPGSLGATVVSCYGYARFMDQIEDIAHTLEHLVLNEQGLLPAIIQDDETEEVLMLAWMDSEALRRTLTEGRVTFWSRSRQEYWRKGDTSGHVQFVRSAAIDCDKDTVLIRVHQIGAACHTGTRSCFTNRDLPVNTSEALPEPL